VASKREERQVYKILVEKPEGKRPLGRPGRRWMGSEWILGTLAGGWSELRWLRMETYGELL
jgi:hypothetical protein